MLPLPPEVTIAGILGAMVLGLFGLVTYGVRRMMHGDLVPRSTLDDALKERDQLWQLLMQSYQTNQLVIDQNEVVADALEAIPRAVRRRQ